MMQRLKATLLQRRNNLHVHSLRFLNQFHTRNLCSLPDTNITDELDNQVLVEGKAWSRTAILNRPSVLNCLSTAMGARLQKLYTSWENNPDIGFVAMKWQGILCWRRYCDTLSIKYGGASRMFCDGKMEDCKEFFRTLYTYIYILGTYLKPHVALLNGITMGGGAGVSIPGMFRVATDKTVFATPETLIGFHPDAGASFFLSHLPGHLGEYLGLTGQKLNGAEMISCGLATHYAHSSKLALIEEQLGKLDTDDPSVIETSLEKYSDLVYLDNISVLHRIEILDKCFSHDTVEEIIDALESETSKTNDAWCISTLRRLNEASPLGLKVSLKSIREGRFQTLDQCLIREYRMSLQGISNQVSKDFCEWNPPSLEQVSKDMVEHYFSPLSKSEPDLELPTDLREAFT
ncbi:3-hydroxyisobutyryl-CoA hydrolase-like protein 1, mitochondrial isoform X3 [Quercus robur]|uniref:3-hydroxyisobutyryl-CoA hydrolase-like protein 1, mitochondrial isoform X3 n=1 Tax=Quercus robur TaxID=38942 RepID=UPI002163EB2B|nr:3-hydroxyisobutyryl-CoA hydrolase-like protein 1, mitochondrial isoform X3 [Quercus robur]